MANNPGSKKAIRKIARRTEVNTARRSRVRTFLRKFEEAVSSGDAAIAKAAFVEAQSELMRAVARGVHMATPWPDAAVKCWRDLPAAGGEA